MVDNLVFSLNATIPIFLMMVLGYILKRIHWLTDSATDVINRLVFKVFLPSLLFIDLAKQDFVALWDSSFVTFCALVTVISILVSWIAARLMFDKAD